jgi:hypothetical protein
VREFGSHSQNTPELDQSTKPERWDGPGPKKHVVDAIEVNLGGSGDTLINEDGSKVIVRFGAEISNA